MAAIPSDHHGDPPSSNGAVVMMQTSILGTGWSPAPEERPRLDWRPWVRRSRLPSPGSSAPPRAAQLPQSRWRSKQLPALDVGGPHRRSRDRPGPLRRPRAQPRSRYGDRCELDRASENGRQRASPPERVRTRSPPSSGTVAPNRARAASTGVSVLIPSASAAYGPRSLQPRPAGAVGIARAAAIPAR